MPAFELVIIIHYSRHSGIGPTTTMIKLSQRPCVGRRVVPRRVLRPARPVDPGYMGSDGSLRPAGHENIKGDSDANTQPNMCLRQMFVHHYYYKMTKWK